MFNSISFNGTSVHFLRRKPSSCSFSIIHNQSNPSVILAGSNSEVWYWPFFQYFVSFPLLRSNPYVSLLGYWNSPVLGFLTCHSWYILFFHSAEVSFKINQIMSFSYFNRQTLYAFMLKSNTILMQYVSYLVNSFVIICFL